ncbi:OLC1v1023855C1 [Oldenlandia corymbosa var. corymbosa]|uniref:OLC1v1023855C1 n=1 Tax=Oldenlandia corymbosa var. corymbosa TaxID=529605 RepID=A0AAV1C1F2_OLDCO|nr:OLC1v1023855C1 [Oldenlandia corymbosa var. corymbosa]
MAKSAALPLLLTFFLFSQVNIAISNPAAGAAPQPINILAILQKAGRFSTFIRLLNQTQLASQINNHVNANSYGGLTVFAATDTAFRNLPAGTLNGLTTQELVQLVLYHIVPRFYTIKTLATTRSPVRTQATGRGGRILVLYFSGKANQKQVNVSTGVVRTTIYKPLTTRSPLAVYQLDKVLWTSQFGLSKEF